MGTEKRSHRAVTNQSKCTRRSRGRVVAHADVFTSAAAVLLRLQPKLYQRRWHSFCYPRVTMTAYTYKVLGGFVGAAGMQCNDKAPTTSGHREHYECSRSGVERPQNEVKVAAGKTEFGMFNVALGTNVALIPLWPLPSFPYPAPHLAHIAEPVTEIHGGADLFINKGSTINLTCVVKYAPEPPPSVTWSHNRQVTN